MEYIKVTWVDHFSRSAWLDIDEIKEWVEDEVNSSCTSVGQITFEDDQKIVLSATFDGSENYGEHMCILKTDIIKREPLST